MIKTKHDNSVVVNGIIFLGKHLINMLEEIMESFEKEDIQLALRVNDKDEILDDVYKEDPTVNALEERIAKMFGKEKALFFPTGSMANQTALKLHTNPGEQVICDKYAHYE